MFDEPPIYYILISLIFLIIFGSIALATWLVWMTSVSIVIKVVLTIGGTIMAVISVLLYTISAE